MKQIDNYKYILISVLFFFTFINCFSQKDSSANIVNYNIITFKYGTSEITDEGKKMIIKLFNDYLKLDSGNSNSFMILQSWTCKQEIKEHPYLGVIRCKKVMEFISHHFQKEPKNFYIDYKDYPINNTCDIRLNGQNGC